MGNYLKNLPLNSPVLVQGPKGNIQYYGKGKFEIKRRYRKNPKQAVTKTQIVKKIGMIAGGSGLTPMLQLIRQILGHHQSDSTHISFIFANVTESDILLRDELDSYASQFPLQFSLFYTLDKPGEGWKMGKGFVTPEMIKTHLPVPSDDSIILVCGPPLMVTAMVKNFDALDMSEDHYFKY